MSFQSLQSNSSNAIGVRLRSGLEVRSDKTHVYYVRASVLRETAFGKCHSSRNVSAITVVIDVETRVTVVKTIDFTTQYSTELYRTISNYIEHAVYRLGV